eukprot:2860149-Amphidinium_carterae.1
MGADPRQQPPWNDPSEKRHKGFRLGVVGCDNEVGSLKSLSMPSEPQETLQDKRQISFQIICGIAIQITSIPPKVENPRAS